MLQALLASSLSSFLGLIGGFSLLAGRSKVERWSHFLVSFAAGAMLGAAFFDLIAEAIQVSPGSVSAIFGWVMIGFVLFFMIERLLVWHHHGHSQEEHPTPRSLVSMVIIGDVIHNLIDGIVIGAVYLLNPAVGAATAIAVFAHEIPQEIGDFSIMIHSGMTRKKIALWNLLGAVVSPIGTVLAFSTITIMQGLKLPLLGLGAGMFIYIAASDLVPEIHHEKKIGVMALQILLLVLGMIVIVAVGKVFSEG